MGFSYRLEFGFLAWMIAALALMLGRLCFAGGGDLMINPTRIIFEKNQRSAKIDLTNTGSEPVTYRITIENRRMAPTGELRPVTKPETGELFADGLIQYSPRQVELAPGSGQTVRLILRKSADLQPGEYRSHLVFSRLPDAKVNSIEASSPGSGSDEIGIRLTALVGVSVPIVIQNGETSANARLSALKLEPAVGSEPPVLAFQIDRTGNRSLYGDLSVALVTKTGSETTLAEQRGLAVYSPNPFRKIRIVLRSPSGQIEKGRIQVNYHSTRESGRQLLAQETLEVP
jgi:hypothetical protein